MNFKKIGLVVLLSVLLFSSVYAAGYRRPVRRNSAILFNKGDMLMTPQIVFIYHTTCLGGNFEYAITRNIGFGGDMLLFLEGSSGLIISPEVAYHFDVKVDNLDLYVGAGPAVAFGFGADGGSEFGFKPFGGVRYYFTPKIAAYFKFLAFIGSGSSVGGAFGATFRL